MQKKGSKPLFSSGIEALDEILQGVIAGDNVVWQLNAVEDQIPFVHSFCRCAHLDGKKLVYFRFADHEPLVPTQFAPEVHSLDARAGFEQFITKILDIIKESGKGACYVFDCLSELAEDWYSDRLLANFFKLACPYLYAADTVAYFSLQRNAHTPHSINIIQATAQIVLDLHRIKERDYILPLKVKGRHTPTMYMFHALEGNDLKPVTKSTIVSEILSTTPQPWIDGNITHQDAWTKILNKSQTACTENGSHGTENHILLRNQLIKMMISRNKTVSQLCADHFTLSDLVSIGKRIIGTGLIGGKSTGMLLARAILKNAAPKWEERLEIHDSFFVGSDVFYSFVINNKCWWERHQLKASDAPYTEAKKIRGKLLHGKFPREIIAQFKELLNYFGQSPIIVRSSSLLEDAYGNAFSGKYESVFCVNQGTPKERLEQFKDAVRTVYASSLSRNVLMYRSHRGLWNRYEEMALLVQRVSGAFYGNFYMPQLAGVGYSFNPFAWDPEINPSEGVLRLVFGLGTRAVDRHDDDYTRIVALNAPMKRPEINTEDVHRYSQHIVDVLDLEKNTQTSTNFESLARSTPSLPLELFAVRDKEMETRARQFGVKDVFSWMLTFKNVLTKTPLVDDMRDMLDTIARAYNCPVDIEFAVNFSDDNSYRINLLQCRPFQVKVETDGVNLPENIREKDTLLKTIGPIIGQAVAKRIHRIIYVIPEKYSALTPSQRFSVARLVGEMSNALPDNKNTMLIGPGRWGSKMPELGVPVSFNDIRKVSVLCELAIMHKKLSPDISLGTHFFNDIVEMGIVYMGIYPGDEGYALNEKLILQGPNALATLYKKTDRIAEAIHVTDIDNTVKSVFIHANTLNQEGIVFQTKTSIPEHTLQI
ncbi:MAG: PEP/pyruvate-binding domain-containing protein [Proteobacteria bacterium]|nr:PEP/pyruvate-binding domain-containing protein [Pseudomonadota bacterium]MBU1060835.1 PEP/pyruvate-binding domain-containing protein [Pseudomonadota bacterium]